jgi:hypothetical protein
MKKTKSPFNNKVQTKKAKRGPKSLAFTNLRASKMLKVFRPSIPDNLNMVQSQPMTFEISSGQFNPPKMLYFGFHPMENPTTQETPTVISPSTVGTFVPPSKYHYGFKPIKGNNKLP